MPSRGLRKISILAAVECGQNFLATDFRGPNTDRATGYCSGFSHVLSFGWNFVSRFGVLKYMQREWTLRQILAIVRGIGVMVGLFWLLVAVQFVPALWRGGLGGVREQMVRIAVTGVAQDHWQIAVMRMDQALGIMGALALRTIFIAENPRAEIAQEPWLSFEFQVSSFVWRLSLRKRLCGAVHLRSKFFGFLPDDQVLIDYGSRCEPFFTPHLKL